MNTALKISKAWAVPLFLYGVLLILSQLFGIVSLFLAPLMSTTTGGGSPRSTWEIVSRIAVNLCLLGLGVWMIVYGKKLISKKYDAGASGSTLAGGNRSRARSTFYAIVVSCAPPFFLLHWNGFLDLTYHWYLVRVGGTQELQPQVMAALVSTVILMGVTILIFELVMRRQRNNDH